MAGDEQLGILACVVRGRRFAEDDAELLRAVANQTAVGLKKAALIERLTAENIVKDMFEALAAGSVETAEAKAGDARCDLSRPHLFLHAERAPGQPDGVPWPELAARLQARLRAPLPARLLRRPARRAARARAAAHRQDRTTSSGASWTSSPARRG